MICEEGAENYEDAIRKHERSIIANDEITLWHLTPLQLAVLKHGREASYYMTHHPADTLLGIPFIVKSRLQR
jgi:hypothetical protein